MKLSIITINRNNAAGLRRTLQSTFAGQTGFDDWEQIVVDGASTDGSFTVLDKWKGNPHLGWHVSEPDTGIYNAMNKGAAHARGDYLLFLNSGDELITGILEEIFPTYADADILYGDEICRRPGRPEWLWKVETEVVTPSLFIVLGLPHQACFISRSVHEQLEGYDESFRISADHEFFLRCSCHPDVTWKKIPFVVTAYGQGQSGVSSSPSNFAAMAGELERILSPVFGQYIGKRAAYLVYGSRIGVADARRCVPPYVASAAGADDGLAESLRETTRAVAALWQYRVFRFLLRHFLHGSFRIARSIRYHLHRSPRKCVATETGNQ